MKAFKDPDNFKLFLSKNIGVYIKTGKLPEGFKDKKSLHDFCSNNLSQSQKNSIRSIL